MQSVRTAFARASFSLAAAFASSLCAVAAPQTDGPYVMRGGESRWEAWFVEVTSDGPGKRVQPLWATATLTVPAVGTAPAFDVKLRNPADISPDIVSTSVNAPLFVVADTHGEFEILADMLQKYGIVDRKLKWKFGRGHLVLLGDVFDRGANQTEILWLIYQLEADAHKAGGGVHLVLGNHETMVLRGDLRYLNPKYPKTAEVVGVASYTELFYAESVLGQWLRTKPAVLKINDLLCVHGGISRALIDRKLTLADINTTVREVLGGTVPDTDADRERADFVMKSLGPLWYRGYFTEQTDFPTATMDDIDRIWEHFGVSKILVGHTAVPTITPLYDGKVIAVHVYPSRNEAGQVIFESLLIRNGILFRAKPDGSTQPLAKPRR